MQSYLLPEFRIERDDDRCIRCQVCVRQCGFDTHRYDEEDDEKKDKDDKDEKEDKDKDEKKDKEQDANTGVTKSQPYANVSQTPAQIPVAAPQRRRVLNPSAPWKNKKG